MTERIPPNLRRQIANAIQRMHRRIRWKTGKGRVHLATRIEYGHLTDKATLADYEAIITHVLHGQTAELFIYMWGKSELSRSF